MHLRRPFVGFLGSVALITGSVCAGELPQAPAESGRTERPAQTSHHQIAQEVAGVIARAVPERGYSVDVECKRGVVHLSGTASNSTQLLRIVDAARASRPGLRIVNEMTVQESAIRPTSFQEPMGQVEMMPAPATVISTPIEGHQLAPSAEHTFPHGSAPQYDMPFMPPYAWPAHAPYPNYSAVQYPKQYRGSDWPYVGPFYPYPERPMDWDEIKLTTRNGVRTWFNPDQAVPANWQKISLRWEDGHWYYRFYEPCWTPGACLSALGFGKIFSHREDAGTRCEHFCDYSGGMNVHFRRPICTHMHTRAIK